MPTLAELAGVQPPEVTDEISIVPTMLGESAKQESHEWLYWERVDREGNSARRGARNNDWKFVQHDPSSPVELHNLADDLGVQKNLAAERGDVVESYERWYQGNRTPARTWQDIAPASVDDYVT